MEKKSTDIRREEIIRAAIAVLGEKGVRGLTIAAIADSAGMSNANIYRHFGGKEDVLNALVQFIAEEVMCKASFIAAGSGTPLAKLERIFFSHMSLIGENPGIPRLVFSEEIQLGNRRIADFLSTRLGYYIETISALIVAGIAECELAEGLSPRETALTFLGMIQFTALRWVMSGSSAEHGGEAERLWENFLRLVH